MAGTGLHHSLSQNQTLAPQIRQSLEILQSSTLELSQLLQQSIEVNPVLEDGIESVSLDELADSHSESELPDRQSDYEDLRELAILENRALGSSSNDEEHREYLMNSLVGAKTLQQHLTEQLDVSFVDSQVKEAAQILIGAINSRGFIDSSLSALAAKFSIPLDVVEEARDCLQSFDPPGVAASDLRECLLIQLERNQLQDSLQYEIVNSYLDALARKQFPQIARALKVTIEEVVEASDHISALSPSPGTSFDGTSNPYILPDLKFEKGDNEEWHASLTNEYLPRIRISDTYKSLLSNGGSDKKLKNYLKNQIRDGRHLIKALDQRQETILAIGEEIILKQIAFLEYGFAQLHPLTMNEIADKIGIHATTVSRAVHGKYVLTPHGVIELRRFFASGYQTASGDTISNTGVRETIQKIIEAENKLKPLSDAAIERALKEQGLKIARRTIAKYREQLGILPSHLRKKF